MRSILSYAVALALAGSVATASGSSPHRGQTAGAQPQRPERESRQAGQSDAREFISRMAIGNMAEVELGKLALERAESQEVKDFAQQMIKDHTQANEELAKVAAQLNVQMPADLDQKHRQLRDRLSRLEAPKFDRAYMEEMVRDHRQTAAQLRDHAARRTTSAPRGEGAVGTAGADKGNQALAQWASKTLPVIEKHLERARQVEQQVKKDVLP